MRLAALLLVSTLAAAPALAADAPPPPELPRLGVQADGATVSGVSSGAYLAVQLHLSQGPLFARGVAAVAGGPFGCAQGSVLQALGPCLGRSPIDVQLLVQRTQALVTQGEIPPLTAQQDAPVASLPHGDQRKLEVALLIALDPKVFMFDEPTAGMSVDEVPVTDDEWRAAVGRVLDASGRDQ
jgi:hypothetical protein